MMQKIKNFYDAKVKKLMETLEMSDSSTTTLQQQNSSKDKGELEKSLNTKCTSCGSLEELDNSPSKNSITKNPISELQEIYARVGITPKYDLVQGAVHEPTFKYRLMVGEAVATGCGDTKQKAKQEAAENFLKRLGEVTDYPTSKHKKAEKGKDSAVLVNGEPHNIETSLLSYGNVRGNPIGELQEMLAKQQLSPPIYELANVEGPPHARKFVVNCLVDKFGESGSGNTKMLAKKNAAANVLAKLKTQNNVSNDPDLTKDTPMSKNQGLSSTSNMLQRIKLPNKNGVKLKSLQNSSLDLFSPKSQEDVEKHLKEISEEQNFIVTYVDLKENSESNKFYCFVQMGTNPVVVCFGVGEQSASDAHIDAARKALEYLRIMTK